MKNSKFKIQNFRILFCIVHCALCIVIADAQSTNQSYPTAITSNEISGRIAARDIGDARLTSYFYIFSGTQGDVFINVETSNFNGDVDIFTHGNLKPLTKITIYADNATTETGRVIYLRQPAKLILRVEGRSPNDEAATFRVKFAGSFEPAQAVAETSVSEMPEVKSENQTDVRVNSVGTIIEVKPKPLPPPKEIIAKKESKPKGKKSEVATENKKETKDIETAADQSKPTKADVTENAREESKVPPAVEKSETESEKKTTPVVVVSENIAKPDTAKTDEENSSEADKEKTIEKATPEKSSSKNRAGRTVKSSAKTISAKVKAPNPLENIRLIILFKDGTIIERAMSEVTRVGVIKGTLTVVSKDGSIGRYSILDVAKMTIE